MGLPWWSIGWESAFQYRGTRVNPWLGSWGPRCLMAKIPQHKINIVINSMKTLKMVYIKKYGKKKKQSKTWQTYRSKTDHKELCCEAKVFISMWIICYFGWYVCECVCVVCFFLMFTWKILIYEYHNLDSHWKVDMTCSFIESRITVPWKAIVWLKCVVAFLP